jgi:hypothetical protein
MPVKPNVNHSFTSGPCDFFFRSQTFVTFGPQMRVRLVVFFVFLFFLLLKGYDVYTGTHHNSVGYTPLLNIEKAQQVKFTNKDQGYSVSKYTNLHKKEEYIIADDTEDEDANNLFARKYKLLAKCYLTLSYLFILRYLYNCFKASLTFCSPLSYNKYIVQRVLRL